MIAPVTMSFSRSADRPASTRDPARRRAPDHRTWRIPAVVRIFGHDLQVSIEHLVPAVEDLEDQRSRVQHAGEHVGAERLSFVEGKNGIRHELDL